MAIQQYAHEIEVQMLNFYNSLSEKDRRRYAAVETIKLGYGGATYIRQVLHCDNKPVTRGQHELRTDLSNENKRIRASGGGRKSALSTIEGIDEAFLEALHDHTAGSPVDETIKWTNLSLHAIAEKLGKKGIKLSVTVVKQLLKKHDFRPRQAFKVEAGKKNIPQRDEQFKNIERLTAE